jgi:hypothetical protein
MKLFVVVRKDLSTSQQIVQSGHAIAEFLLKKPDTKWDNGTLVVLGLTNLDELNKLIFKLDHTGVGWVGFQEPDIGNELTAIACDEDESIFSGMELL